MYKYVANGGNLYLGRGGILINSIEKFHNAICTVQVYQLVQNYARTYLYSQAIFRHVSVAATNIFWEDNITNQNRVWLVLDICNRPFIRRPAFVRGYFRY